MAVVYLNEIAGLVQTTKRHFNREQWTTCHASRLSLGDVFSIPVQGELRSRPVKPVVLTAKDTGVDPESGSDVVDITARCVDTETVEAATLRANTSVLLRCDLYYSKD